MRKKNSQQLIPGKIPKIRSSEQLRKMLLKKQKQQQRKKQSDGRDATKRNT